MNISFVASPLMKYAFFASLDEINGIFIPKIWISSIHYLKIALLAWSRFCHFVISFHNFSNIFCWCTYNICPFNKWVLFTIKHVFTYFFDYFNMFQWNEYVEMNKFLCSLACTWMTIIDSHFYIIDSLSLDVSLEWNANLVVAWL